MDLPAADARQIIERVKSGDIADKDDLHAAKRELARERDWDGLPPNAAVLDHAEEEELPAVRDVLARKPVRTLSGVATCAVMWMWDDFSCPYDCAYCPQGSHDGETAPKSYTGKEPSARRAIDNAYDPYDQVRSRLEQYQNIGHPTDKAELIIMGGTFPSTPDAFQEQFIKRCFDALNGEDAEDLTTAHRMNETADNRNVGLTIETRPDFATPKHVDDFLRFGCTRVEMGVQTLDDRVQELTDRGHGTDAVVDATRRLKDCGFKLTYHMMLGLPGEDREQDLDKFRQLFADPRFQPDELKIYPTAVINGTKLHEIAERGEYEPLDEEALYERLERIMPLLPPYVRVKRIMRDIPSTEIDAGASRTNARQILRRRMDEKEIKTREIRSREVGHVREKEGREPETAEIVTRTYDASGGTEQFLEMADPDRDIVLGYLRLRFPGDSIRDEIDADTAVVRQLQVVGPATPLDADGDVQHSGYGTQLMQAAEERARDAGYGRLAVISAVGTRAYYRKLGYERDGPYMARAL